MAGLLALALLGRCGEAPPSTSPTTERTFGLSADEAGATLEAVAETRFVRTRTANCRAEASTQAAIHMRLKRNDEVGVAAEEGGWSRLMRPAACWVRSDLLIAAHQVDPPPPPVQVYSAPRRFSGGRGAFRNCSAARAAGAAPVYAGEPGYGAHLDRDGDGVGCE